MFRMKGDPPAPPEEFFDVIEPYSRIFIDHPEATCMDGILLVYYFLGT